MLNAVVTLANWQMQLLQAALEKLGSAPRPGRPSQAGKPRRRRRLGRGKRV
ncbi:MAG TPA: hypothetical protein VNA25_13855 [Phycisphaerae bacterium]|nr:hypothetical protein [Phycisphaerae bacterium]